MTKGERGKLVLAIYQGEGVYVIPPEARTQEDVIKISLSPEYRNSSLGIEAPRDYIILRETIVKKRGGMEQILQRKIGK